MAKNLYRPLQRAKETSTIASFDDYIRFSIVNGELKQRDRRAKMAEIVELDAMTERSPWQMVLLVIKIIFGVIGLILLLARMAG